MHGKILVNIAKREPAVSVDEVDAQAAARSSGVRNILSDVISDIAHMPEDAVKEKLEGENGEEVVKSGNNILHNKPHSAPLDSVDDPVTGLSVVPPPFAQALQVLHDTRSNNATGISQSLSNDDEKKLMYIYPIF